MGASAGRGEAGCLDAGQVGASATNTAKTAAQQLQSKVGKTADQVKDAAQHRKGAPAVTLSCALLGCTNKVALQN